MGKLFSMIIGAGLALWLGWILVAADESVRIERAAALCGGTAKVLGSVVRAIDADTGEELYAMHSSWSASCQGSVWYFFSGADDQKAGRKAANSAATSEPAPEGGTAKKSPSAASSPSAGTGRPIGEERL